MNIRKLARILKRDGYLLGTAISKDNQYKYRNRWRSSI